MIFTDVTLKMTDLEVFQKTFTDDFLDLDKKGEENNPIGKLIFL